jgi:DNA-binding PadR family transcriptional regulator
MFGYLKIFVLKELMKSNMSGYDLMGGFKRFKGSKPSPGTIYPLLSSLKASGLITVYPDGKKKIYGITPKGDALLKKLMDERKKALQKIIPLLSAVYSKDELGKIKEHLNLVTARKIGLQGDFDVVKGLRDEIFKFAASKHYSKRRQEFRKLIMETIMKIKRLR